MKKLILISCLAIVIAAGCNSEKNEKTTDSPKVVEAEKPVDTAAMNKAWAVYMTPGEVHKMLTTSTGKWTTEISMYYTPDAPPTVSKAICENSMILGGRYLQSSYKGSFEGMPFEGISTLAYDNAKKIYISTWIDNMGTGLMYLEGTFDESIQTLNMKGKATDVVSGKDIEIRETMKFIDKDTQQMDMYETKNGKEMKNMSILLRRVK